MVLTWATLEPTDCISEFTTAVAGTTLRWYLRTYFDTRPQRDGEEMAGLTDCCEYWACAGWIVGTTLRASCQRMIAVILDVAPPSACLPCAIPSTKSRESEWLCSRESVVFFIDEHDAMQPDRGSFHRRSSLEIPQGGRLCVQRLYSCSLYSTTCTLAIPDERESRGTGTVTGCTGPVPAPRPEPESAGPSEPDSTFSVLARDSTHACRGGGRC
jgi:hypothetical protein